MSTKIAGCQFYLALANRITYSSYHKKLLNDASFRFRYPVMRTEKHKIKTYTKLLNRLLSLLSFYMFIYVPYSLFLKSAIHTLLYIFNHTSVIVSRFMLQPLAKAAPCSVSFAKCGGILNRFSAFCSISLHISIANSLPKLLL